MDSNHHFHPDRTSSLALSAGASSAVAETIGVVTDLGVSAGGTFAIGTLTRVAAGGGQLVHLTSIENANAIRAAQTLGRGRSTVYAGPQSLSRVRGWRIALRTGLMPSKATEVILIPPHANRSFLVVQPIGPLSLWHRYGGTVYSVDAGVFNLTTGAFTRVGAATNQLVMYGLDSIIVAGFEATGSSTASIGSTRQ